MHKLSYVAFLGFFTFCTGEERVHFEHFHDRLEQNILERLIITELQPIQTVNLSDYEIFSPGVVTQNSSHLYLIDFQTVSLIRIPKENPDHVETWKLPEGDGPGEIRGTRSLAVDDEYVYIGDSQNSKVVVLNTDGEYIQDINTDFLADAMAVLGERKLINYSPLLQPDLFIVYSLDTDSLIGFEPGDVETAEAMKYVGYLASDGEFIYFSAYAEPLIRKYDANGNLIFSRSTIDNFDTADNYQERRFNDNVAYGFSENAKFSTLSLDVHEDFLYIITHPNDRPDFRYLDQYDSTTGDYTGSIKLDAMPHNVSVDSNYLYTLAQEEEDYTIRIYENNLD